MGDMIPGQFAFTFRCALTFSLVMAAAGCAFSAGQALDLQRPVLDHSLEPARAADYEKAVETVMALSEEEMLAFLPEYSYTQFCECPNCYGGVQGNNIFTWTVERPDEMTCRHCGTVYPNDNYPEQRILTGQNALGKEISFPYHFNEEKEIPHFLSNHLRFLQRQWIRQQTTALARVYRVTENPEYARRVALILERVADRYPQYPAMRNRGARRYDFLPSQEPPYPWDGGRWGNFHNEIPVDLVRAYDLVYDSPEFDRLSQQRGYDLREKIETDLFKATFAAVEAKPNHIGNVVGYDVNSAAVLGGVIGEPHMVHWAFKWMVANVTDGFYADGMWNEGAPSYHYMTLGGLRRTFDTVRGYTDPTGYTHPETGRRFDDLDPEQQVPFWAKVQEAPALIAFPDGARLPVHDSWAQLQPGRLREQTRSAILPALGHAALGRGLGTNQMQAHLHFSGAYGHAHYDNLNLILWAKQREMLPDIGYSTTQLRYWTTCSLSHNLVVVDRQDQNTARSDGNLLQYFPDVGGVAVAEAEGTNAYREIEGLDTYQRLLLLVTVSDEDAYVVDVFRVRGGSIHDWTVQGDATVDTVASTSLTLTGERETLLEPGEGWEEPTITGHRFNPYGLVRDVKSAITTDGFHVEFRYEETPERAVRTHMPAGDRPSEIFLGRSPSVRRMGTGAAGDMRKAYDFWMPKLIVRRQDDTPLHSVFTAVHEPVEGSPFITTVERLELSPEDVSAVALRVTHGDTTDIIISTLDEAPYPERTTADGISLRGRLGILRQVEGVTTAAWLFEGERLSDGQWSLETPVAQYAGELMDVMRKDEGAEHDAFVTDAELPTDGSLNGVWMIVTHGDGQTTRGFEIERVERHDGNSLVILADDPGLQIEGGTTSEVYHPTRSFQGANLFRIPCAVGLLQVH